MSRPVSHGPCGKRWWKCPKYRGKIFCIGPRYEPGIPWTNESQTGLLVVQLMRSRGHCGNVQLYGCSEQTYIWASWYSIRESRVSNCDPPISSGIASTSIGTKSSYKSSVVASGTSDLFLWPPEERSEEYLLASGDDFWLRSSEILLGIQNNANI